MVRTTPPVPRPQRARLPEAPRFGDLRLLDPETCELAWAEQFSGEDRVLGMPVSRGLGYGRLGGAYGWGGALVMIDPTRQLVVAYATNQMREPAHDSRGLQIAMAALAVA